MKSLLGVLTIVFLMSCESDTNGSCSVDQWVGEYTIQETNTNCNATLTVVQVSGNTLSLNTVEGQRDGCTFSAPTFQVEATLNASEIVFSGLGCTATYIKN